MVATLVLIVVAIVGAVAVATIVGSIGTQAGNQANIGQAGSNSQETLSIGGSTTVYPVLNGLTTGTGLAASFEKSHPGVDISLQQGGSGGGMTGVAQGVLDIGVTSSYATYQTAVANYPAANLQAFEIGGSAVVMSGSIVNSTGGAITSLTKAQLQAIYASGSNGTFWIDASTGAVTVNSQNGGSNFNQAYQRSDTSGTEETFAKNYLGSGYYDSTSNQLLCTAPGVTGNEGMASQLQKSGNFLGFIDFGYAYSQTTGNALFGILGVDGSRNIASSASVSLLKTDILTVLKGSTPAQTFPTALTRNFYLVTAGNPNALELNFIKFCQGPDQRSFFNVVGTFSIYDYKP